MIKATSSVSVININDGKDGKDAEQLFNWIVYADSDTPEPNEIFTEPENRKYIGFAYNKTVPTPSNNPSDYQWVGLDGHVISEVKQVYYSSAETDSDNIPWPFQDLDQVLYVKQGHIYTKEGYVNFSNEVSEWGYEKPEFKYGQHLWVSTEIITNDGEVIYSEPIISAEWEVFYSLQIGGTQLIRNSKTLIDDKIYWRYE